MILKNGRVLNGDFHWEQTDLTLEDGVIVSVGHTGAAGEDLRGAYVVPGLIDIHTHGRMGFDHLDGTREASEVMCRSYASCGTTSILATVMTQAAETMLRGAENAARSRFPDGAHIRGVYLEGPFFSDEYRGAQHPDYLRDPDPVFFGELQSAARGTVRILSLAPERRGAVDFIRQTPVTVFLGHTAADYETAKAAIAAGAKGLTHTFNAMTPFTHRAPGILGAAFESGVICECICDGKHVHPSAVRALWREVGRERFCVISDSLCAAGLPDGEYASGGQPIVVHDNLAYLKSGTVAGSVCCPLDGVRNLIAWGVAPEDAFYAASAVPAKAAGLFDRVGSIEAGKSADLLILNDDFSLSRVLLGAE